MAIIVGTLGWIGAATVLIGYLLFSAGKIPNGPLYQLLNLAGSVFICINVFAHQAWPSTIVNGIWAIIAAVVLVQWGRRRRAGRRTGESTVLEAAPELPTTTLVLPVIGPAVRAAGPDPTAEASDGTEPAPSLQTAPIAERVPVVTAAIAVVVANAMREQRLAALSAQLEPERAADR